MLAARSQFAEGTVKSSPSSLWTWHAASRQRCSLCDSDSEHLTAAHPKACLQTGEMADCSVIVHSEMKMSPHPPHPPLFFPFISQAYKDSFLWSCITRLLYSHTLVIWHDQDGNRGRGQGFARASPGLEVNLLCWAQNKFDKINTNIEIKATQKISKSKWRNIIFVYLTFKIKNTNQEPHHCRIDAECSVYCGCSSSGLGLLQLKSGRVLAYLITPNNT